MPFDKAEMLPIANSALTLVGTRLLSDTTDASKECTLITQNWDTYRRAVLRDGLWKFAKEVGSLEKDSTFHATFGFTTRYALPDDFLRLVVFNDKIANSEGGDPAYGMMHGYIYTDMSYANLVYISDVEDVKIFDPLFCEAFSAYIAANICNSITGSPNQAVELAKVYKTAMQKARFVDSVGDPSATLDMDVWLQARVGGPSISRDPQFAAQTTPTFP